MYINRSDRNTQTMRTLNTYLQTNDQAKLMTEHVVCGERKRKKEKKKKNE
jgi:hypothetical protein